MRYRLRSLVFATAIGPPLLALLWHYWPAVVFAAGVLAIGFAISVLLGILLNLAVNSIGDLVRRRGL